MIVDSLIPLLALRRKLFWAKARSRNAKIAVVGGLIVVGWVTLLLVIGGASVGAAAGRLAKAAVIADVAFGIVFVCALAGALVFGLDNSAAFSDESLRRYPLTRFQRLVVRYAAGLFDPLWLFVFVLDVSIAVGFAIAGTSPWWVAIPASTLLFATNYLAARLFVEIVARTMAMRGGPVVLLIALVLPFMLPGMLVPALRDPSRPEMRLVLTALKFTPPLAVAAVVAGAAALACLGGLLVTFIWLFGIGAAIVTLEGKPIRSTAVAGAEATWDDPYDRAAAAFGLARAPLVGRVLRYYVRAPWFWINYPLTALAPVFFSIRPSGHLDPSVRFLDALATMSIVGFGAAAPTISNLFGFDRAGFRRYFLLPVSAADIFRAVALAPLTLGGIVVPVSVILWLFTWRGTLSTRMVVMLLSSGFGGLLLFHALALWTSLLTPRPLPLKFRLGNRLSLAQNALTGGAILVLFGGMAGFERLGAETVIAHWWAALLFLFAAATFYLVTLHAGARVLRARRERMLSIIERGS